MSRREEPRAAPRSSVVAVLDKRGRFLIGEPFFGRAGQLIVDRDRKAAPGDLVLLRVGGGRNGAGSRGHAQVERRIGRPDVARDVLEALMLDRGLRRRFDPAVERAAREAGEAGVEAGPPTPRRDLRELVTFTIDPSTARDFDDAISAERRGEDRWRIWVHIADVSAYVPPGSLVDKEAHRPSTSVYVPGKVEPMLPEALSNGACSLRPDEDRLAVTVEVDLHGATVERTAFYRSLIRSHARLDYERVDRAFSGEQPAQEPWATPLAAAREAAAALHRKREQQGQLAIESSEPDFAFDGAGHVTAAHRSVATESHRLIEHLMILANEQVARILAERRMPALYRVHEQPEGESAERLVAQLASLDVPTPPTPEYLTRQQAAEVVAECSRLVEQHVQRMGHGGLGLSGLVLRALKLARYDPQNLGHAGLGLTHYCHFTSPIRRYPDLVCHRALLSAVGGGEEAPVAAKLTAAGEWTSARERDAMSIERAADDVARAFLLERELFERGWEQDFEGEVTGVIGAGAFVAFGEGFEGMLPVRKLHGEWWELNEEGTILHGTRHGGTIRIGDPVRVQVARVETARGRVDLLPVELG